jgi:hypothetical protein
MANFQRWERQILPQGRLLMPEDGPSLAESFGSIDQEDSSTARSEGKEASQPNAADKVAELQRTILKQLPELRSNAAEDLSNYPDLIDNLITRKTEAAVKDDNLRIQRYVRGHMNDFRASATKTAIKAKTAVGFALQASRLDALFANLSQTVVEAPDQFDSAIRLFKDAVDNSMLPADEKGGLLRKASHSLALRMFTAWIRHDPKGAERALSSSSYDELLDETDRRDLVEAIQRNHALLEVQARAERSQAETRFKSNVLARFETQILAAETEGSYDIIPMADLERAFGARAAEQMQAELAFKAETTSHLIKIRTQSLAEDEALLASLNEKVEHADDGDSKRRRNIAAANIAIKQAALQADPAGYVASINPDVRAAWDAVLSDSTDFKNVTTALAITKLALGSLKLTPSYIRPVPRAVTGSLLDWIKREGNASNIARLQQAFSKDYRHFLAAVVPAAGPYLATALILDQLQQRSAQNILLAIAHDPKTFPDLVRNTYLNDVQKALLQDTLYQHLKDLLFSYAEQPGGGVIAGILGKSAEALAMHHVYHDQKSLTDAASFAARELGTESYSFRQFRGHVYRIPAGYSAERVASGADEALKLLANLRLDRPVDDPYMPIEMIATSLRDYGFWVTVPDESGLMLRFYNNAVASIGGKPIQVPWPELDRLATQQSKKQPASRLTDKSASK